MSKWGVVAAAAAVAALSCSQPDPPPSPAVYTLFDVQALYDEGRTDDYRIAVDSSLPGGIAIGQMMSPEGALTVHPTWAEGYNAAYVVTEVWTDFDELWVQPAYEPVTGWSSGDPQPLIRPWEPIFSVGPGSRFYSPFWQMFFVDVPDGTAADALTSAEQVLNSGYPLHPDRGRVMVMYPEQVTLADPMIPGVMTPVGNSAMPREGWLDGARGKYLEFQSADLRWNDRLVIEEVPIYHFVARTDDGALVQLPIPTVAGTGPPYSNTPAPITPDGSRFTSRYAGYWRLYTVVLPTNARVFAPPARPEIAMALDDVMGFPQDATYSSEIMQATVAEVGGAAGMVALSPACFATGLGDIDPSNASPGNPSPCRWLDSQQHIEEFVPEALIQRTNVTVTCPFVSFRGQAVIP